jgi:hypothetical protein
MCGWICLLPCFVGVCIDISREISRQICCGDEADLFTEQGCVWCTFNCADRANPPPLLHEYGVAYNLTIAPRAEQDASSFPKLHKVSFLVPYLQLSTTFRIQNPKLQDSYLEPQTPVIPNLLSERRHTPEMALTTVLSDTDTSLALYLKPTTHL